MPTVFPDEGNGGLPPGSQGTPGRDVRIVRSKLLPSGKRIEFRINRITYFEDGVWVTHDFLEPFYTDCGCSPLGARDVYQCLHRDCGRVVCGSHCMTCQGCGRTCCSEHIRAVRRGGETVVMCEECVSPIPIKVLRKVRDFFYG